MTPGDLTPATPATPATLDRLTLAQCRALVEIHRAGGTVQPGTLATTTVLHSLAALDLLRPSASHMPALTSTGAELARLAEARETVAQVPDVEHAMELGYTNADDGIWLRCDCGWETLLDFSPTVEVVAERAAEHRADPTAGP